VTLRGRLLLFALAQIAAFGLLCSAAGLLLHAKVVPILDEYLERKTRATLLSLASSLDVALGGDDPALVRKSLTAVGSDPDMARVEVRDGEGAMVAAIGLAGPLDVSSDAPRQVVDTGDLLVAWAPVELEGYRLGTVAIAFSKARQQSISAWMTAAGVTMVVAVLLAVLVAFRFSRSFVGPIHAMVQFSRRVKEGGLSERVVGPAAGELSILSADLNAMAAAIEARDAALAQRGLELEQSLDKLRDAQEQLVHSTRLASVGEMAGRTAHEVLNPMTSIHFRLTRMMKYATTTMQPNMETMAEIVSGWRESFQAEGMAGLMRSLSQPVGEDGQMLLVAEDLENLSGIHGYLTESHRATVVDLEFLLKEADRVTHIVDGMRSLSRVSGTPMLATVRSLLEESLETMRDSAARRNIELDLEIEIADQVCVDRYEFVQILGNLLRNAFLAVEERHGRAGGRVSLDARRDGGVIQVRVRDNGCGIPAAHLAFLFEASFTTRTARDGTGLGLSIARRLARSFHGELAIEETRVGGGSTFLLEIPAADAAPKGGVTVAA